MSVVERPNESVTEFTLRAVLAGIVFGVAFGAANAYLGLKAGLTVSTSIPIAVLTVAVFRLFKQRDQLVERRLGSGLKPGDELGFAGFAGGFAIAKIQHFDAPGCPSLNCTLRVAI